jgi:hypothetical protein
VLSSAASFIGLPQSGQGFRIGKSIVIGLPLPPQHSSFRRRVSRPAPKNCVQGLYRDTASRSRRSPPPRRRVTKRQSSEARRSRNQRTRPSRSSVTRATETSPATSVVITSTLQPSKQPLPPRQPPARVQLRTEALLWAFAVLLLSMSRPVEPPPSRWGFGAPAQNSCQLKGLVLNFNTVTCSSVATAGAPGAHDF